VLLYKPWRRRIDKKRIGDAHFTPLPQSPNTNTPGEEEEQIGASATAERSKTFDVTVEPVETTNAAGPAHR
jgi:high-affinity nickel-transport protein